MRLPVIAAGAALVAAAALLAPAAGSVGAVLAGNSWRLPLPDLEVLKGPEPNPTDPDDDHENLGPDPPPPPVVVHTTTEVTSVPPRIEKGQPFVVEGRVVSDDGVGLPAAPVDVYLNETKDSPGLRVAKGTTDGRGRFAISAEVPPTLPARQYQVVASMRDHVQGALLYVESWSDPPTDVHSKTRLQLRAPDQVATGDTVRIVGRVEDVTGGPVREVVVALLVDGESVATTTTAGDGSYAFTYTFRVGGAHEVTVRYEGSVHYDGSFDTKTVHVGGNGLEVRTSRAVVRGAEVKIEGRVSVESGALEGWDVDVTFQGLDLGANSTLRLATDAAGTFDARVPVPTSTPTGTYVVDYAVPSLSVSANATLTVQAGTALVLSAPERVGVGEPFRVNATLVEDTGAPLPARAVDLRVGDRELHGFTDENGTVRWSVDLPGGSYRARVSYQGDDVHHGSDAAVAFAVDLTFAEAARPWWPWVVAGLLAAGLLAWALHPSGRRAIRRALAVLDPRAPVALSLDLPGVETDLPDVWGVGEPLSVVARAATKEGAPLPSLPLTLEAGAPQRATTDATGRVRTEVSFAAEGTCTLVAAYAGDRGRRSAEAVREVRVVDYRRVIEEGFEDLRRLLAGRGVPVHEATPPRELERRIHETVPTLGQDDLDRLLTLFEVSDYSEHPVGRDEWVVFQRARSALETAIGPPPPARRRARPPKEAALAE